MEILERFAGIVSQSEQPVVLELGACDGYHTALMTQILNGTNKHYQYVAFEPDARLFARLEEAINSCREGACGSIELVRSAVGATDGTVDFYLSGGKESRPGMSPQTFHGSSSIRRPTADCFEAWPDMRFDKHSAACTRLDTFCRERFQTIDFIWADIQGAEIDLIEGGRETLARTRFLYTEYCNAELYEGEIGLAKIMELLPGFKLVEDYGGDALLEAIRD